MPLILIIADIAKLAALIVAMICLVVSVAAFLLSASFIYGFIAVCDYLVGLNDGAR